MRLYIIRHADPDYENNTITPPGHLEARALANRLSEEKIDAIYSSPMGRALHTMQYTAEITGLEPVIQPWLAELSGWKVPESSGKHSVAWNVDGERIRSHKPFPSSENWHSNPIYDQTDLNQRFLNLKKDSDLFLKELGYERNDGVYEIVRTNELKIAVFCHMGFGLAWISHLLELPLSFAWSGFWLAPSSVTTILFDQRTAARAVPRCLGMGDVSHLYKAGLPVQSSGIIANFY
ncbi:histidine phosphatase family protein [Paenibacillus allorhizosphaerae]|uniref:Histidine phosphatase family protein n=1 Tax=Paenibacillus allorhizosphaerae TaxID=2849866 RepID=A0ABM8VP65_9BACL|nr:histidine phosphatase family protein [Paenibacillus allorhizosphaerae]CAG7652416.1 hypothetical protein PAECIP111802_05207 [Paenibacillus allorhizosphaerae]